MFTKANCLVLITFPQNLSEIKFSNTNMYDKSISPISRIIEFSRNQYISTFIIGSTFKEHTQIRFTKSQSCSLEFDRVLGWYCLQAFNHIPTVQNRRRLMSNRTLQPALVPITWEHQEQAILRCSTKILAHKHKLIARMSSLNSFYSVLDALQHYLTIYDPNDITKYIVHSVHCS